MLDWLITFIANDWTQRIATFIGGAAVILGFLSYLSKFLKNTTPIETNKIKHSRFNGFLFPRRYNQHVIYEHRMFNVRGLRTQGTFTLQLEKVFVELRIAHSHNPQKIQVNPVFAKEFTDSHPIWDFLKFKSDDTLVLGIIGAPGCGKTTLLQHIALIFASKQQRRYKMPAHIPLLLFLRQHVQKITADKTINLAELAQAHFTAKDIDPPADWFAKQLNSGQCLVLLDGLDEVADLEQRKKVSEWVDEQVVKYPHCQFVITSRPQGYLTAPVERANVLEVQPFNTDQVKKFIHAWYLENEVISFGHKIDDGIRHRARDAADDLIQRLRGLPALSELTVNPLLLTMIAMVHRYRGQLPGRRVELYAEICDVLLGHWRQARGIEYRLTAAQKRVALQPLAAYMMQNNQRDIRIDDIKTVIAQPLQSVSNDSVKDFLADVQASSGLFLETEIGEWRFAHLTFQEYLAACHFLQQKLPLDWSVDDSWWHETLRLYAAQGDATLLVQACLESNTIAALTLAADCLEEALILDATIRQQLETRLINDLESEDVARRKLAAEVRLRRRLKNLQRIDEQREIDLDYITCAEYQLFLDDKRAEGKYYQPKHWTANIFSKGTAKSPVCGICAEDAEIFCEWLTQKQIGGICYRLPQPHEAQEYPPNFTQKLLVTWCKKENTYSLNWLIENNKQKDKIHETLKRISDIPWSLGRYARTIAIAIALDISFPFERLRVFTRYLDAVYDPLLKNSSNNDLALGMELHLDHARFHAYDLLSMLVNDSIYQAIKEKQFEKARTLIEKTQSKCKSDLTRNRLFPLVENLLACIDAKTVPTQRQTYIKYVEQLSHLFEVGSNELKNLNIPVKLLAKYQKMFAKSTIGNDQIEQKSAQRSFHEQLRQLKKIIKQEQSKMTEQLAESTLIGYNQTKQKSVQKYNREQIWQLEIAITREQGKLPAWEGIRIVREKKL